MALRNILTGKEFYPTAPVSISSSGPNEILAAGTNRIGIIGLLLVAEGTVTVQLQSASNNLSGAMPLVANVGFESSPGPMAPIWCNYNEAFNINLGGAVGVYGWVIYTRR